MSWYVVGGLLLAVSTVLAVWTASCWPLPVRDSVAALATGAVVALWMTLNGGPAGPRVTALVALPALMLASLLMGRTVLLAHPAAVPVAPGVPGVPDVPGVRAGHGTGPDRLTVDRGPGGQDVEGAEAPPEPDAGTPPPSGPEAADP